MVGGTNTFDYPTVLAAKREMASWKVLHLEPSAMRTPDSRSARPRHVSASGGRLPATLHALIRRDPDTRSEVVNRLRQLNSDVEDLDVHTDEIRNQLVLRARLKGTDNWLYGRSLSDGTLRYIAMTLMLVDVRDRAVLCIEEPENGIHPSRVPNLTDLLRDYAVDIEEPVAPDNPLRQVTVNTHSPEVVRQFPYNDIRPIIGADQLLPPVGFRPPDERLAGSGQAHHRFGTSGVRPENLVETVATPHKFRRV